MSHWAEIDNNNQVLRVLVGDNDDPNGDEGYQWLLDNLGGRWIQTSYDNNFRRIFAPVGGWYDEENDRFLPAKRDGMENFIFDEEDYRWIPHIPYPTDEKIYTWNKEEEKWVEVEDVSEAKPTEI